MTTTEQQTTEAKHREALLKTWTFLMQLRESKDRTFLTDRQREIEKVVVDALVLEKGLEATLIERAKEWHRISELEHDYLATDKPEYEKCCDKENDTREAEGKLYSAIRALIEEK